METRGRKHKIPKEKARKRFNDNACWECGKPGHCKKNCFVFKNKLKKIKGNAFTSNNSPTKGNLAILDENSGLNLSSMDSDVYCAG